jgi:hypothetical protein
MKKYYLVFLFFLIVAVILFFSCNNIPKRQRGENVVKKSQAKKYKVYSKDSLLMLDLILKEDSLKGNQCFSTAGGEKTDCCLDEISINTKLDTTNGKYEGTMRSCYVDTILSIEMKINKDTLILFFLNDDHQFLPKENVLFKSR